MKRKLLAILVLLAMCISLAPAMAEEELPFVTIDWYFGQAEQTDSQIVNDALNEILLEKFNCNVNMHFWSGDEYWDNMRVMISSGQDVGIIGFGSQTKLDYVTESQRGAYYPLDDLLTTIGADTYALFDEEIWEAMRINGNIYGIPSLKDNGYFISLVYNATMAEELGIDMESVEYNSFDDWEEVFYEVKEKRDAAHPEWADYPVVWDTNLAYPYYFAFETFFNDAYFAVCKATIATPCSISTTRPNTWSSPSCASAGWRTASRPMTTPTAATGSTPAPCSAGLAGATPTWSRTCTARNLRPR